VVFAYYRVLRSVLRDKQGLFKYLTRCRICRIFFFNDPRNVGRTDIGCPFGCAECARKAASAANCAAWRATEEGKKRKKELNDKRPTKKDRNIKGVNGLPQLVQVVGNLENLADRYININKENEKLSGLATNSYERSDIDKARHPHGERQGSVRSEISDNTSVCETVDRAEVFTFEPPSADLRDQAGILVLKSNATEGVKTTNTSEQDNPATSKVSLLPCTCGAETIVFHPNNKTLISYIRSITSLIEGRHICEIEIQYLIITLLRQHSIVSWGKSVYTCGPTGSDPPQG